MARGLESIKMLVVTRTDLVCYDLEVQQRTGRTGQTQAGADRSSSSVSATSATTEEPPTLRDSHHPPRAPARPQTVRSAFIEHHERTIWTISILGKIFQAHSQVNQSFPTSLLTVTVCVFMRKGATSDNLTSGSRGAWQAGLSDHFS